MHQRRHPAEARFELDAIIGYLQGSHGTWTEVQYDLAVLHVLLWHLHPFGKGIDQHVGCATVIDDPLVDRSD